MCARRFLIAIFFLILLFVAGAFAVYQWGGSVLISQATPKGHFEAQAAGSGPDYSSNEAWLARSGLRSAGDPVNWRPEGAPPATSPDQQGAVFYVHPTTYLERDRWNAPLHLSGYSDARTNLFLKTQASAFSDVGEVWAPRYRQAAFGAFLLKSDDAGKSLQLAYGDVKAAFDQFLQNNASGPIILAGHSQGALHLLHLLADRKDQIKDRLVGAYVIGWPVGIHSDLPATGLPPCERPDEAGCVLSWQSFGQPANHDLVLNSWVGTKGLAGTKRRREDILCVNPILGSMSGKAEPASNSGTLVPDATMTNATLAKGLVGADCNNGFLEIFGDIPAFGPFVLPGNNYHVYDYALFWGDIRRDAGRRLAAWQNR